MKQLHSEALIERDPKQVFSEVDGEIIMLSIRNEEYYSLNNVASRIWRLLESPMSVNKVIESLTEEYEVDNRQCLEETKNFIDELYETGLIMVHDAKD